MMISVIFSPLCQINPVRAILLFLIFILVVDVYPFYLYVRTVHESLEFFKMKQMKWSEGIKISSLTQFKLKKNKRLFKKKRKKSQAMLP